MNEVTITLDKFQPRDYQLPIFKALEQDGYKKLVVCWARRSGKDLVGFNLLIRQAFKRVGAYYYVFPTFSAGRRILWNSITNDGVRVLDFIPPEVILSKNEQMMSIKLINGSMISIIGATDCDKTLVGTNPIGMVFSEYASLVDDRSYAFSKPILHANGGWVLFLSTPRRHNHFYNLWQIALQNPDVWYSNFLTVKDTKHISEDEIQADIDRGEMNWELAQQEYYCSFEIGASAMVWGIALDNMKANEQISNVPWQPNHKVNCAWDVGNDMTSIIFFQCIGQVVNVIDYYENSGQQLEHYVNVLNAKQYTYNKSYFPHDMRVTEWGGKKYTRLEKARQLGIKGEIVDSVSLEDGIEYVKSCMPKIWIDAVKCNKLIKALESYRYEYDKKLSRYKDTPLHDKHSHGSDSFRYMCLALPKSRDSMTQEDVDRQKREALYANDKPRISSVFEQPTNQYFF